MTKIHSSSKHEPDRSPRRKGHGRVDEFAKTHLRGLEELFKAKREMLKKRTQKLMHRRHSRSPQQETKTASNSFSVSRDGPPPDTGDGSASRASGPAANGKQFYQHVDNDGPLHDHYEDDIASALGETSLAGKSDGAKINSNRKLAIKLAVDYDYDEQACLAEALEASAREKRDFDEEVRAFEMVLRRSVKDQGGARYHTYSPPRPRVGESSSRNDRGGGGGGGGVAEYNPDADGETSMMGSLRGGSRRGDDPPPAYTLH